MKWRYVASVAAALVVAGYAGWTHWETRWYMGMVPAGIGLSGTVEIDGQSGLTEGCGAAVFRLSEATVTSLNARGIDALAGARQARAHDGAHHAYSEWRSTPHVQTGDGLTLADRWLAGMGCASLPKDLGAGIRQALKTRGAFYATTREAGLIVIPSLGVAVFSYFG